MSADSKKSPSPIEHLLNVGIYAPLGLLLQRNELCEQLVDAGRRQVAFSRSLGQAALQGLVRTAQASPQTPEAPETPEVPGFDSMTARELVAFIAGCSTAQAEWIRGQEMAGKKRVTVLRALDSRTG